MTMMIGDCETDGLLDEVTKLHCICFSPVDQEKFYVFCDMEDLANYDQTQFENTTFFPTEDYVKLLDSPKTTGIVIHNIFGYDLPVFNKLSGVEFTEKTINKRELEIIDTLVWSRYLNPERQLVKGVKAAHGLQAWGVRLGIKKPEVEDWENQPLDVYIHRVIEDVKINKAVYFTLLEEKKDVAISNGQKQGQWDLPLRLGTKTQYLMTKQERDGCVFDIEKAKEVHAKIKAEMQEIEKEVEPDLGERVLPQGQQPKFPKVCFKKAFDYNKPFTVKGGLKKKVKEYLELIRVKEEDQVGFIKGMFKEKDGVKINQIEEKIPKHPSLLTQSAISYCLKHGIEDPERQLIEVLAIINGHKVPRVLKEKLRLSHKKDTKEFLIKQGWVPTIWKYRNIMINPQTKQKLTKKEIEEKLDRYLKEFNGSVYWPFIIKDLGLDVFDEFDIDDSKIRKIFKKKGRELLSSPQYKDARGTLCPNFETLGTGGSDEDSPQEGNTAKKIVRWLSLQNRMNTILSDNGTGWLAHTRLNIDGRLPSRSSGITPTYRQKHSVIVNVPKPSESVVYGKEMRSLFMAPGGYWNIGCDAAAIEGRVASHFAWTFDGGKYAESILGGSYHEDNAKAYSKAAGREITRSQGKNLTYAILYGAQAKKISVMASVSEEIGQRLIDAFWDANIGLKRIKEAVEKYWIQTGKKYVMGIDGRKVYTRSQHSLLNSLFQSTGAIIMDFAGAWCHDQILKEGLDAQRWGYFHDEYQYYHKKQEVKIHYSDASHIDDLPVNDDNEPQRKKDPLKPQQEKDTGLWSAPKFIEPKSSLDNGMWVQYYSRVGELIARGIEKAGEYFNMNLPFPGEYMVGENWSECH